MTETSECGLVWRNANRVDVVGEYAQSFHMSVGGGRLEGVTAWFVGSGFTEAGLAERWPLLVVAVEKNPAIDGCVYR
eukprot:scaffold16333_cov137-Cylindrotheca_fusiformis.AAC.1